ncbi:LPS translocon maturation chaperone LptM [Variovorax boronicumulans]|uniref:LPS translocon maturation chaperone LptM n=1 Tax=Variovorax boronicumulans TaxID=436515 RepID=UPI0035A9746B
MSAIGLCALGVGLSGCGLKGPLYLPTDPAAAQRATLPELLTPSIGKPAADADADADAGAAPAPAPAASAPVGAPR